MMITQKRNDSEVPGRRPGWTDEQWGRHLYNMAMGSMATDADGPTRDQNIGAILLILLIVGALFMVL